MADRSALQPVKLVKRALVRHEADKVEHVVVLGGRFSLIVHHEGVLPREAVVSLADFLTIADSMAFVLAWQTYGEAAQVLKLITQFHLRSIHQNGQDGLRGTGVVDHLIGEE